MMTMPLARFVRLLALILVCAAPPWTLRGQTQAQPGARVRILAPSAADTLITGTVVALDSASLLLSAGEDREGVRVPLAQIRRLEVAGDRAEARRRTGLWGLLVGGAAGYALLSPCRGYEESCDKVRTGGMVAGAAVGMLLGQAIGGGGPERWRPVPVAAWWGDGP